MLVELLLTLVLGSGKALRYESVSTGLEKIEPYNVSVSDKPTKLRLEPLSFYRLKVTKMEDNTEFLVFEAHSLQLPLIMSYTLDFPLLNSTSPALYVLPPGGGEEEGVLLYNPYSSNNTAIVFVRSYSKDSPVPGKCNVEPGIHIKPYLDLSWTDTLVEVSFSQAGHTASCSNIEDFSYDVYEYFLPEGDCSRQYFDKGYNNFVNPEDITENGHLVTSLTHHKTKLSLVNYARTGRILAVMVNLGNSSALYGLVHTYGCEVMEHQGPVCFPVEDSTFVWVSCALGVFVGLFLTLMGHRFYMCSQFIYGLYLGSLVGYLVISLLSDDGETIVIIVTTSSGLLCACVVLATWCFLGIPVLSTILPTLEVGFLLAGILMYLPLCGIQSFSSDTTYWLAFMCITLSPTVLLIAFTQKASIISSAVIGSFTTILAVDHYTGSNLKYIINNVLHRATLPSFGLAHSCPPFQKTDLLLLTCLLGGIALGLVCQLILERRKPPFPPAPYQQWRWAQEIENETERTPLMTGEVTGTPEQPTLSVPVVGFIANHSQPSGLQPSRPRPRAKTSQLQASRNRDIFSPAASETYLSAS